MYIYSLFIDMFLIETYKILLKNCNFYIKLLDLQYIFII